MKMFTKCLMFQGLETSVQFGFQFELLEILTICWNIFQLA